jgi:hypothetical protein
MHFNFATTTNVPALSSYSVNLFQANITYPSPNPPLPAGTQNVAAFPQNPKDQVTNNWLFGIQQEVARNTILTVNYVANNSHHMQAGVDFAALNANAENVFTDIRPLPGFASEAIDADGLGSNYNSLQAKLRRSMGNLTFEMNYTWSHEFDDMLNFLSPGFENPLNPKIDHASGDWDVRNNMTGSVVYGLPDLKGSSPLVRGVLGGWQTSGILQTRSGLPTNITLVSGLFGNPERPDYVPGVPLWVPNHSWPNSSYNINAFTPNPAYDGTPGENIGTVGRNSIRGPAYFQFDLSGMKNFPITERITVQFRADIFNLFNHPNFEGPDGGICTAISGPPAVCTTPNANFGRTGETIADADSTQIGGGTNRQTQFSLKVIF